MKTVSKLSRTASSLLRGITLALGVLMACQSSVSAQIAVPCPQNIDFSFGNFNNWTCYTGTYTGAFSPWVNSGPVGGTAPTGSPGSTSGTASQHALTTGPGTDPYGGFPVVAPGGGLFSLLLGNEEVNSHCEMVRYYIHVPVGFNNYSFNFKYAVVFQNPSGHASNEQPRFLVNGYDSATGLPLPCATQTFVADDPALAGLGFQSITVGGETVKYLPWTVGNLNLSGSGGKTIIVEVVSADCALGGHFGYGYFDVTSCGQFNTTVTFCDLKNGIITMSGPPGYQKYEWFNQTFTTRLNPPPYNNQSLNLPPSAACQYYNLVLTPYSTNGCPDTIRTKTICNFTIDAKPDSLCNTLGKPVLLTSTVTGGLGGFKYQWSGGDSLSKPTNLPYDTLKPHSSGYITLTVTDSNGCFRQDTVKIENPNFTVNLGPDITTCLGTSTILTPTMNPAGAPGYVFNWSPGTGLSSTNILNPTFTPLTTGSQVFALRVDSGICATSDTMRINVLPNTFNTQDEAVCEGQTITLHVTGNDTLNYFWTYTGPPPPFGSGPLLDFPAGNDQTPALKTDTTRTFTITAKYPGCPDVVKTLLVRVEPIPTVDLGEDTLFKCVFQPAYITTHVGPSWFGNYAYQWAPNQYIDKLTSPIILFTGNTDTMLYVTASTPLGCKNMDSIYVHVYPGKFGTLAPIDPAMCPRNAVTLTAGGGASYRWDPPLYLSSTTAPVVSSEPVTTTEYTVYVSDSHGCVDTLRTTVTVNPEATVSLPDTVVLYPGESYQLSPAGNLLYYSWFPTVGLSPNAAVSNPLASPTVNTRYYVTGTTEAGCKASDSIYVLVRGESAIAMANAFSPGSAPNAEYKVMHMGTATLKAFRIYNRWGVKVFETSDINKGWDGTYSGEPQPMGVYIYTVEAISNTGKAFVKQGNVTLIR